MWGNCPIASSSADAAGVSLCTAVATNTEIGPLHVGQTLAVNIPAHLQLHRGGFHLRQINSSLVPPTVRFCCRMSTVCPALKVLLSLHVKAPKLPHRKKWCPSLLPFHIKWTFCNVHSLWFYLYGISKWCWQMKYNWASCNVWVSDLVFDIMGRR
jgi:hypothetical protein